MQKDNVTPIKLKELSLERVPDGMLMTIHICSDRFDELLHAFYKGSQ